MPMKWSVRLSETAQRDFDGIYVWTAVHFGVAQARTYRGIVLQALKLLRDGPDVHGTRSHPGLPAGFRTLHVMRSGKRGRHFIVFDTPTADRIRVVRILHEAMDLSRHVTNSDETGH